MKRILGLILTLLVVVAVLVPMAVSADDTGCRMTRKVSSSGVVTLRVYILQDGVNSIGVTDTAPSAITYISGGRFHKVVGNKIEAVWFGPYERNDVLTLRYEVESIEGWYTDGSVEYYIKGEGPFVYETADQEVVAQTSRDWRYYLRNFSRYCRGRW